MPQTGSYSRCLILTYMPYSRPDIRYMSDRHYGHKLPAHVIIDGHLLPQQLGTYCFKAEMTAGKWWNTVLVTNACCWPVICSYTLYTPCRDLLLCEPISALRYHSYLGHYTVTCSSTGTFGTNYWHFRHYYWCLRHYTTGTLDTTTGTSDSTTSTSDTTTDTSDTTTGATATTVWSHDIRLLHQCHQGCHRVLGATLPYIRHWESLSLASCSTVPPGHSPHSDMAAGLVNTDQRQQRGQGIRMTVTGLSDWHNWQIKVQTLPSTPRINGVLISMSTVGHNVN